MKSECLQQNAAVSCNDSICGTKQPASYFLNDFKQQFTFSEKKSTKVYI